jgi:hypothetical protein
MAKFLTDERCEQYQKRGEPLRVSELHRSAHLAKIGVARSLYPAVCSAGMRRAGPRMGSFLPEWREMGNSPVSGDVSHQTNCDGGCPTGCLSRHLARRLNTLGMDRRIARAAWSVPVRSFSIPSVSACLLAAIVFTCVPLFAQDTVPETASGIMLAEDGHALLKIVISEKASERTVAVAAELAQYLQRITGAEFEVGAGDGTTGVVLGTLAEFPDAALDEPLAIRDGFDGREAYAIRSERQ